MLRETSFSELKAGRKERRDIISHGWHKGDRTRQRDRSRYISIYQHISNKRKARFVPYGLKQTQELLESKKFLSPMNTRQTENMTSMPPRQ